MKNFWLDRKSPKKTKINIWLGASITEHGEQDVLLETIEVEIPKTEAVCLRARREGENAVHDVTKFNPFTAVSKELDDTLYHRRIGQALVKRYEEGHFGGKSLPVSFMKQQWTPGEGNKLFREEKINPNNKLMPFYVFHIRNETAMKYGSGEYGSGAGYIEKTDWKAVSNEV